jgi:hypothetical protein
MLRWLDEAKLKHARKRMKRVILQKHLAKKLKKPRAPSPPPTARLLDYTQWEKEVEAHIDDLEEPTWWLKHVRPALCTGARVLLRVPLPLFCHFHVRRFWDAPWSQAEAVDKMSLVRALERRGVVAPLTSRRWILVDLIRHWATTFLPPEARFARQAELTWLREVEEMGGYVRLLTDNITHAAASVAALPSTTHLHHHDNSSNSGSSGGCIGTVWQCLQAIICTLPHSR